MTRATAAAPLLEVIELRKYFPIRKGLFGGPRVYIRAVDGVDLAIAKGQSYGLVGESGSGKTTLVRCVLGLIPPSSGRVHFAGQDITELQGGMRRRLRARMQIVFQDPYSSLNPRMPISRIIGEPLVIHGVGDRRAIRRRVERVLDLVGLKPDHLHRYPHEFSGGQRQRIAIARALALEPELLVLDEPTSALDVSVQAQILNLLMELQQALGLTYLMISHDLSVIRHMCDTVGVMYGGKVVELSDVETLFSRAAHPYTRVLLATVPRLPGGGPSALVQAHNGAEDELSNAGTLIETEAGHWVRIADAA